MSKMPNNQIASQKQWKFNPWKKVWQSLLGTVTEGYLKVTYCDGSVAFYGKPSDSYAELIIHDKSFYSRVIFGGSVGLGETYVDHIWSSPDLSKLLIILGANVQKFGPYQKGLSLIHHWFNCVFHLLNKNNKKNSLSNIQAHYDLSNDFYKTFLDPSMSYSSAYYDGQLMDLEKAQLNKIRRILDLSELKSGSRILEIGSGWGALAFEAAQRECFVKTITLSKAQHDYVVANLKDRGLEGSVEVHLQDYRDEAALYDNVISCEMIEAVGKEYLECYFRKIKEVLKNNGLAVLQAITIRDSDYEAYSRSCDWIQKHIFPGGHLPSLGIIHKLIEQIDGIEIKNVYSFGADYAKTLNCWDDNFVQSSEQVKALGFDEKFQRKWRYYFSYCIAGFTNELIDVQHIVIQRTD
jgi:cyclopropane-fatty-acyl-phospholipid synthase